MKTLYLNGWEVSANLEDRRVVVSHQTTGEVQKVALFSLQRVVCVGQPHLTMPLLHELMRQGITIVFLNGHGECLNAIYPTINGNAPRRLRQYAVASDPNRSLPIAKALIDAKIRNLRRTLQRLAGTRGLTEQPAHRQAMDTLQDCRRQLTGLSTHDALRGCEGIASACYFAQLDTYLPPDMPFVMRTRRPPRNPVNALLSWTYAIITNDIVSAIRTAELDPCLGVLHQPSLGRPALALDLIEPFRAPLCDLLVIHLINHRVLTPDDFDFSDDGAYSLKREARRKFFVSYETTMQRSFRRPGDERHTTFRDAIQDDAYAFCQFLADGHVPEFFLMP